MVAMVASGLSNKAIARQLAISIKTVEFHLSNVYRKVGVGSRGELAAWVSERWRGSDARRPLVDEASDEPRLAVGGCDDVVAGTPFVGREHEQELLRSVLASPARLVTVVGAAGMGKTRLARRVATEFGKRFAGGAWFVELAPVATAASVADVVLRGIGGRRAASRTTAAAIAERCQQNPPLVVLDNCEHVRSAAADVATVVVAAGGVVLATSREPLRVPGERLVPLPPLADAAAVELFTNHATGTDPSFRLHPGNREAVLQICRRLDGMPLAIELAASRVRALRVAEILARLDARFRLLRTEAEHRDPRQRTLLGAVQWSYDLLAPAERQLFCRLSTFAGGFDLVGADTVAAADGTDELDTVEVLDGLVARSMIVAEVEGPVARFRLLETLRQFGAAQLTADEERELRSRHARHYVTVAEHARRVVSTQHTAAACRTFELEWDNLRHAFEWTHATGAIDWALRLVLACDSYASPADRLELLDWAERAIIADGAADHDLWPAVAGVCSRFRLFTGDVAGARALATAALDVERARGCGHSFACAEAAWVVHWTTGETARAAAFVPCLEAIAAASNDPVERGHVRYIHILSRLLADGDEPASVRPLAEEALRSARRSGNPHELALAYIGLLATESKCGGGQTGELYEEVCRWAAEAGNVDLANSAALWIAAFPADRGPRASLVALHAALVHVRQHGVFHNLELSIYTLLQRLVQAGRFESAAVLVGGLEALETAALDDQEAVASTMRAAANALGPRSDELVDDGRRLTKRDLLALAIDEVEQLLVSHESVPGDVVAPSGIP